MQLLGVDTGGTFTDFVWLSDGQLTLHKVLSTPQAPEQAILQGITELGLHGTAARGELLVIHGSTVATNAALEGKGVRTAYISNRGFGDLLTLARQTRPQLYQLQPTPAQVPVPPELCLETGGRINANGDTIEPLTEADLKQLRLQLEQLQPEAVAINLLFSFLDPSAEQRIAEIVPDSMFCSRSSEVLPEYKEYERGMATWLNAWLGPLIQRYLQNLQQQLADTPVAVMQSSGGTISAAQAASRAVNMLLSGPAGGLAAASHIGNLIDSKRLLTFDMGGTSTDVALIDGEIQLTSEGHIADYPVAVPMVDMHTIGAGGGSIAQLDSAGMLTVGPQSAGADPGPACYGRGGREATVTDANAVLGRLRPDAFLGGEMALDLNAAKAAVGQLAQQMGLSLQATAEGIITLANEHMARALRVMSVQRGQDPADYELCCFGGAGGLHVCALAEALGMQRALVPARAGVFSALGMLVAPRERQLVRTWQHQLEHCQAAMITQQLQQLAEQGQRELLAEGVTAAAIDSQYSLDLCYAGQSYTLNIPWQQDIAKANEDFQQLHQQRYGHRLEKPVQLVNLRCRLFAHSHPVTLPAIEHPADEQPPQQLHLPGISAAVSIWPRQALPLEQDLNGPLIITETTATTLVAEGWRCRQDRLGNLRLRRM